ncbi:tRNA (guanine-N(7)-)-methyltransferase non-catalytic subunit wdr4-like protein [Drosera capensis]
MDEDTTTIEKIVSEHPKNDTQLEEEVDEPNGTTTTEMEEEVDTTREAEEETQIEESSKEIEVAPALIAVHPCGDSVVVAVGSELRVFNLRTNSSVLIGDGSKEQLHKDSIRAVRFSEGGKFLVSAGDDKLVKIWDAGTWQCIGCLDADKRVSAVAISKEEQFVCFADKFGVVWAVSLKELNQDTTLSNEKPVPILSHYCSIITSLEFSPDDRYIVSADRDSKIRVTVFPKNHLAGAHEIQSFCLGHSEYVSCVAFVQSSDQSQSYLLSGSGDSTVRLWDFVSGSLLCTCDVGAKAGLSMESHPAVTDLSASHDGSLVAVATQSFQGVLLISCNLSAESLSVVKVVSFPGETFVPTKLASGSSAELLWMVSGVSSLPGAKASCLARVKVASGFNRTAEDSHEDELTLLDDSEITGGEKLLEKLQGSMRVESELLSAAADAVRAAMSNLLMKKQYTVENRDFRKRRRNDRKLKKL